MFKPQGMCQVLGKWAFETSLNSERLFLHTDWGVRNVSFAGYSVGYTADIAVSEMNADLQREYPERSRRLQKLLGVNLSWRIHLLSQGQRRRVQLFVNMLRPFKVILLDEVTSSLDVLCRVNLLQFLREESERGATILFATHIFDGMEEWVTDVLHLKVGGTVGYCGLVDDIPLLRDLRAQRVAAPLMRTIEQWMRDEDIDDSTEAESGNEAISQLNKLHNAQEGAGGYTSGRLASQMDQD